MPTTCAAVNFTGKERDSETGLDYFGARYLSAAQGRFTSTDLLMASADPALPQSWNRYSYVLNNPLRLIDPTGELWVSSGDTANPYSWVDQCGQGQTCYNTVAASIGTSVRVYGSNNSGDISNYDSNDHGVVDLNAVAGQHNAAFEVNGGANNDDRFTTSETAAAFFNGTAAYAAAHAGDARIVVTSASLADGTGHALHRVSHGTPNSAIDFLYLDAQGHTLRGAQAATNADATRMTALFDNLMTSGFNQSVSGRPTDFATGPPNPDSDYGRGLVRAHQNHGHVGIVDRLRPRRR
jgi:RHS repeat-associated protein